MTTTIHDRGERIAATAVQHDDDEHGEPRVTPIGTVGYIEDVFEEQENCYLIGFDNGASIFLSEEEFDKNVRVSYENA